MVTLKNLLLHHLEYTFEKEAWQPSLLMAVQELNASQAAWTPGPERHSIWQMVRRITLWKQATREAWEGTRPLLHNGSPTARGAELEKIDWQPISGDEGVW